MVKRLEIGVSKGLMEIPESQPSLMLFQVTLFVLKICDLESQQESQQDEEMSKFKIIIKCMYIIDIPCTLDQLWPI